jgi:hypothetical protein
MSAPALLRRIWERSWSAAQAVSQAVLLPAGLFVLYFFGLGFTWALAKLLGAELLRDPDPDAKSFWNTAEGYEPDPEDCLRQS